MATSVKRVSGRTAMARGLIATADKSEETSHRSLSGVLNPDWLARALASFRTRTRAYGAGGGGGGARIQTHWYG